MPALLDTIDPDGLLEFSVVFTDRSLSHMSAEFQGVMRDISGLLREVYNADAVALPGVGDVESNVLLSEEAAMNAPL